VKHLFDSRDFNEDEATKICNLAISLFQQEDKMIWIGSSNGDFFGEKYLPFRE
jgi:hypothetical protein